MTSNQTRKEAEPIATTELFHLLEFDKLLATIKQCCTSSLGKLKFDNLCMMTSLCDIDIALRQVAELKDIFEFDASFPLHRIWDIRPDLEMAAVKGNFLKEEPLTHIYETLATSRSIRRYLQKRKETYPELYKVVVPVHDLSFIENEIRDKIDFATMGVKDTASPKLNQIRKRIEQEEKKIKKAVDSVFSTCVEKGYLQDPVISLSDERLVLPVKIEHRHKVKGLVHNQSASGATIFIEPIESFEINNKIRTLRADEAQETARILTEITAVIGANIEAIVQNLSILSEIDFIYAKATFAKNFSCNKPALNESGILELYQAKHPLLLLHKDKEADIVPLNLKIKPTLRTLVITGPNAGGKSVALKTIGLLSLMTQCGILIPAKADSNLPVFDVIFTDIGDYQSIEHDLSTFSSHINRIKSILTHSTNRSLVLIDEIGTGTDPEEGAALATAILQDLTDRGCLTVVTTHLGSLKAFAHETPLVENGSMEFDNQTLQPVYKFRIGLPGSSYALEISKRLGIPEDILSKSKELIGKEKTRLDSLILDMEKKLQQSEKLAERLEIDKSRLEGLTNLYKERYEALQKEEKALKKKALEESERIVQSSKAVIEKAVKEIKEQQASSSAIKQAKSLIDSEIKQLSKQKSKIRKTLKTSTEDEIDIRDLRPGVFATWKQHNSTGEIISISENEERVLLQIEQLKFWVPVKELQNVQKGKQQTDAKPAASIRTSQTKDIQPVLDVRGERLEDAIVLVDKFLDDAILAGWREVRIIHGKGTGALRKGISDFLETHQNIKSKKQGAWNEGDSGITIVELT